MDNQTPVVMPDTAQAQPVTSQPTAPATLSTVPVQTLPKKDKGGGVFVLVVTILLFLAAGALGYLYKTTNDSLKEKSEELAKAYTTVEEFQALIDNNPAQKEKDFIVQHNDAELSRSLCGAQPVLMSDVHLNDQFAVFRYLCANIDYKTPIRIAALKRLSDGGYEFTYGASTANPNGLPSYIYDSEPEFFGGPYGASKF